MQLIPSPEQAPPAVMEAGMGHAGAGPMQGGGTNDGHTTEPPVHSQVVGSVLPGPQPAGTATLHDAPPQSQLDPMSTTTGPGP